MKYENFGAYNMDDPLSANALEYPSSLQLH
jgi:hypothetical protein